MAEGFENFDDNLRLVWNRGPIDVEFTYKAYKKPKLRRSVRVDHVLRSTEEFPRYYLKGFCSVRQEQRTFNIDNIESKIKFDNHYYDPYDFLKNQLGINTSASVNPSIGRNRPSTRSNNDNMKEGIGCLFFIIIAVIFFGHAFWKDMQLQDDNKTTEQVEMVK